MSKSRIHREEKRTRRNAVRAILAPKLTPLLRAAWDDACWALTNIFWIIITPQQLATRGHIARHEHARFADLIRNLEHLARRIILAAAFAVNLILKPLQPRTARIRHIRKRRLAWPNKPEGWRTSFRFLARASTRSPWLYPPRADLARTLDAFPLAKRLEAIRRVLARPDQHIRRSAIRLARLAEANRASNGEPRKLELRADWASHRIPTPGERWISYGMARAEPAFAYQLDRFNQACEPG